MTDTAVRSIRIAKTLNDRLGAVMTFGPLGPTNLDDFELRIGEAQQLYPEIWSHLDQARTELAGRGVDTSGFDAIRAQEPKGALGVTRVDVAPLGGRLGDDFSKRAHFNYEGHQRAAKAAKALMAALPEVNWQALDRAENAEIAAAGSLGPSRLVPLAVVAGLALVGGVIYYFATREPDYEGQRQARIAELTTQADAHPCKTSVVRELAQALTWDGRPAEKGRLQIKPLPDTATTMQYGQRCIAAIADYRRALEANPCDKAALAGLQLMFDDRDGNHEDARDYETRCKDKP